MAPSKSAQRPLFLLLREGRPRVFSCWMWAAATRSTPQRFLLRDQLGVNGVHLSAQAGLAAFLLSIVTAASIINIDFGRRTWLPSRECASISQVTRSGALSWPQRAASQGLEARGYTSPCGLHLISFSPCPISRPLPSPQDLFLLPLLPRLGKPVPNLFTLQIGGCVSL